MKRNARKITIFSESQTVIQTVGCDEVICKVNCNCLECLAGLADYNKDSGASSYPTIQINIILKKSSTTFTVSDSEFNIT